MGYGGHLIWTSALVALKKEGSLPLVVAKMPMLSDLLTGHFYNRGESYKNDPIFLHNPNYIFAGGEGKNLLEKWIDKIFILILSVEFIRIFYETVIHRYAESKALSFGERYVYLDMRIHSYAEKVLSDRIVWKKESSAAKAVLSKYKSYHAPNSPEMFFLNSEKIEADSILFENGVLGPYVVIEPDSNEEYFGGLRSWSLHKWRDLIESLMLMYPKIKLVRVGVDAGTEKIPGVIDLRGKTSFRQAAIIISKALFFIGTEGGLMHASKAVNAKSVILWGGVTLPEFAGYPETHQVICNYVSCAPCGFLGSCPNGRICMDSIDVKQVLEKVSLILQQ
jgi:Glycosyltransferase family 9 (heptosyltransferase)